ncbi:cytidine deaminase [Salibacter halophilus]|uniref:Cytidine deaminase n=1 Tax=Salibacter halophilus TaxID=1803916 RepID=A0A6N6MBD6_9FLAO|nr:cytidine deaminase [Salibacter halophilus]KAB1066289.1 cytidine deaminase [Salibacter halophilus]
MAKSKKSIHCEFEVFDSIEELSAHDRSLIERAIHNTKASHSPYSNFRVGAAIELESGKIVDGANQENKAFPSGLCAERVAMFGAAAQNPNDPFVKLAISAKSPTEKLDEPVSPCGDCRQVMAEYTSKFGKPFELFLYGETGKVFRFQSATDLLPLIFSFDFHH